LKKKLKWNYFFFFFFFFFRNPLDPRAPGNILSKQNLNRHHQKLSGPTHFSYLRFIESNQSFLQNQQYEKFLFVDPSRQFGTFKYMIQSGKPVIDSSEQIEQKRITSPFSHDVAITPSLFAATKDGKYLFSCGHWDNSFKLTSTETGRVIQSIIAHDGMFFFFFFFFFFLKKNNIIKKK